MKPDLKGYTVFLTGGSSGLGFEMAKALLLSGATVIVAARAGNGWTGLWTPYGSWATPTPWGWTCGTKPPRTPRRNGSPPVSPGWICW